MKLLLALAALVRITAASEYYSGKPELDGHWKNFKGKHGKQFKNAADEAVCRKHWEVAREKISKHNEDAADEAVCRKHWEVAREKVSKHNEEAAAGLHSYTIAENLFSDWSAEELEALVKTIPTEKAKTRSEDSGESKEYGVEVRQSPASQLVDCSSAYGNNGCNGGLYTNAWNYVKATGQTSSSTYPYNATVGTCSYTSSQSVGTVASIVRITAKDTTAIQTALANNGPVSAALSGIYSETNCASDGSTINHGVVLVGYGTQNGTDYWIVRNSWAATWGQSGYALMKRGVNQCNIEAFAAYPTV